MIELFEFALSGNCHKIRLMLSLLGVPYESRVLNGSLREHKLPEFLEKNPLGQVPVLKDDLLVLRDSQAILVYLAKKYGDKVWFPDEPAVAAEIMSWLSLAANEISRGLAALRAHHKMNRTINVREAQDFAMLTLKMLNEHLCGRLWLVTDHPTIADIAIFPYVALAHEAMISLDEFPQVTTWINNIKGLNGYVAMPGM